jgi:probable F420-dependent oxidoreductase
MKFGLHLGTRGVAGTPQGLRTLALKAEALGFVHLGFSDHVVIATDVDSVYPYTANGKWFAQDTGYCLDQLSLLSYVAGFTDTIRLLTSVMVVPYRHPVLTAKMLATADVVSNGRVTVGIGAGWMAEEMALLDSPPHGARGKVTDEYVRAFQNLWTEPLPAFAGEFVNYDGLLFEPKPVQKPYPPLWMGGEAKPARRRAALLGDAWYPVGNNPRARFESAEAFGDALDEIRNVAADNGRDPDALDSALLAIWFKLGTTEAAVDGSGRRVFTGDSAAIIDDIEQYARRGLGHLVIGFESDDLQRSLETLEQFSEEVIAAFD